MTPLRRRMIDDMTMRNFTPKTIQAYVRCVARFARYFNRSPDKLGPEQMRAYLLHLRQERQASTSYYNQIRCALRFFYEVTLGRDDVPASIVPARQPHTLPVVLSADEVARFFAAMGVTRQRYILFHRKN
jgi:integrase/recombinase XerD